MSTSKSPAAFSGGVNPDFDTPSLRDWLLRLPNVSDLDCVREGACPLYRAPHPEGGFPLAVKCFPAPANDAGKRGSDAASLQQRARAGFDHAMFLYTRGELTPHPVAWVHPDDSDAGGACFLVTEFLPNVMTFREALLHHYYENPLCRQIMRLLETVAVTIRDMHQTGFLHRDLKTQNLLVRRDAEGEWDKAWVIDLGRGKILPQVTPAKRGADNGCILLPSDLRRVFHEMQFAPEQVPAAFHDAERKVRHHCKRNPEPPPTRKSPQEKDIWIWDDRSMQAVPALRSKDKRKYYRRRDVLSMAGALARRGKPILKARDELMAEAWTRPVPLEGKIGLSLNLEPERFDKERRWLAPLGPMSLLVRLYHHENDSRRRYAVEAIRKLRAEGHTVAVALVQDRRAILFPEKWQAFVEYAGGALSGFAEALEVGHAINRVKWGIWDLDEYQRFLEPFRDWSARFPQLPLWGPAGIDFEYPRVLPLLDRLPEGTTWSAFSHHLYVDRRGAPENEQSGYDLVRKLALARAMARVHPASADRLIVSEVNWPLQGTGVWSPVGSPYQSPGPRENDPSVDEETYAAYMVRYYLLALCSGMAERVYWWNLAAHGFGLIDDRDPGGWRPRPAYHAMKRLVELSRKGVFREKLPVENASGGYHLRLERADGEQVDLRWDAAGQENPFGNSTTEHTDSH
ncbi:MAG: hypothetical protein JJU29_00775 [Verrucomicrobia bacterium]|nr:hypothetical protein [Verrucomicrobiota bacterium]MCH8510448.1 lipopolysaccharide kinase InaA family protein [Kiritimatiellia bacterium]